jgi:hypothetical protein
LLLSAAYHNELGKIILPVFEPLVLSPYAAACKLGLPFAPAVDDPYGDVLFAGWFMRQKRSLLPLVSPDLERSRRTALTRRWGLRVAAAMLVLALGMAGWEASDLATTLLQREKEAAQLTILQNELTREQANAAPVTEPLGRLRQALERQRVFTTPVTEPWAALKLLDQGLGEEARLTKLELRIEARLTEQPNIADREATVSQFRQVAQNLIRALPDYTVEVARYPFPALPREALSNGAPADKNTPADKTAAFTIRRTLP